MVNEGGGAFLFVGSRWFLRGEEMGVVVRIYASTPDKSLSRATGDVREAVAVDAVYPARSGCASWAKWFTAVVAADTRRQCFQWVRRREMTRYHSTPPLHPHRLP